MPQPRRRFTAPTLDEAYERVRREMGDDALIVSTRTAAVPSLLGGRAQEFVEVVAEAPLPPPAAPAARPTLQQDLAAHELVRGVAEAAATGLAEADLATYARTPEQARVPAMAGAGAGARASAGGAGDDLDMTFANPLAGSGRAEPAALERLTQGTGDGGPFAALRRAVSDPAPAAGAPRAGFEPLEVRGTAEGPRDDGRLLAQIGELRELVERLVTERAGERVEQASEPLHAMRRQLLEQDMAPAQATRLLDQVGGALVSGADAPAVRALVEHQLAASLPPVYRLDLARRPVTVFLVGPAGAGRTTLALRLGLQLTRAHSLRVTVASTDVTRIGAPQQLEAFGEAAGLPVQLCYTPADLQALLAEGDADVVIVDNPGHSGARRERLAEQTAFVNAVKQRAVLLALPATMKPADLRAVVERYRAIGVDGLAFTRCDETATYGSLLSLAAETRLGIAYTTHGDRVTEAPRGGDNHALAAAVVTGDWPAQAAARTSSAARGAAPGRERLARAG